MDENLKIAVFFDAENIPADKVPLIIDYLSTKGDILFQRAYADWSVSNTKSWKDQLNKTPITAIQQFHHNEKQAVDKLIMMDAIEMAIKQDNINAFALVASDNGYHSLALRLRELGKRVMGIGEKKKCNPIWIKSCNEFSYLEELEDNDEEVVLNEKNKKDNITPEDFSLEKFLEKAFHLTPYYNGTNTKLVSQMWETIYRQKSDFNVKDYGVKSPRELLLKFEKKFKLSDDGKPQRTFFVEEIEDKENGK
ncbi:MAG: NYN domain-containing protein [Treponemataceae bacterium]